MSENQKSFRTHLRLAATFGLFAIVVPVISGPLTGAMISPGKNPFAIKAEVQKKALKDRTRVRTKNRAFVKAADRCRDLRAETGEDIDCPDVNDESSFLPFLKEPTRAMQKKGVDSQLKELSARDRALVRQSVSAGYCSERLVARNLYRLCKQMLNEDTTPKGYVNHKVHLEIERAVANPGDLRARIRQIKNARGTMKHRAAGREVHYKAR